jgi:hypothetical protein
MMEVKNDDKLYVIQVTYPFPGLDESEQEYDSFVVRGLKNYLQINSELETLIRNQLIVPNVGLGDYIAKLKLRGIYVEKIEEFYLHIADDNQ